MQGRRILGGLMAVAGIAVLAVLGFAIYNSAKSNFIVDLGIPGALLTSLAGLVLMFIGGALVLGPPKPR